MLHILIDTFTEALNNLGANPPLPSLAPPSTSALKLSSQQQETAANTVRPDAQSAKGASDGMTRRRQESQRRAKPSAQQMEAESQQLLRQQRVLEGESQHESMREARKKLPAFGKRQELLKQLKQHSVVIISGATGGNRHLLLLCTLHM